MESSNAGELAGYGINTGCRAVCPQWVPRGKTWIKIKKFNESSNA